MPVHEEFFIHIFKYTVTCILLDKIHPIQLSKNKLNVISSVKMLQDTRHLFVYAETVMRQYVPWMIPNVGTTAVVKTIFQHT